MFSAQDVKSLREKTGAGMMDCKKALEENNGDMEKAIVWLREKGISKAEKKSSRIAAEGLANIFIKDNKAIILEVNSETDFVAKNAVFVDFVKSLGNSLLASDAKTMDEAMDVLVDGEKVSDALISITSKIGEKISFRRFDVVNKNTNEVFGDYIHMGGKIAVLTVLEGNDASVAKDVAMHVCAMKPIYLTSALVPQEVLDSERAIYKEQAINEGKKEEIAVKMVEGRLKKYFKEVCLDEQPFVKDADISVGTYVKNNNSKVISVIRYEVGEGMEKRCDNFAEEVKNQING